MKKWLKRILIVIVAVIIVFFVGTILWAVLDYDGLRSIMGIK